MDPDRLLDEINALSRNAPVWFTAHPEAAPRLAHKVNQLADWIEMGGRLPRHFTRHAEVQAAVARRVAEQAGC